jgi:hypothetical protein
MHIVAKRRMAGERKRRTIPSVVMMTIWVYGWQMQCCGEPFSVGARVTWTLHEPDTDLLATVLGPDVKIDAAEEHHGGVPEDAPKTTGTVRRIEAVHFGYAPKAAERTEVRSADGWTKDRGELKFAGYLVRLVV